MARLSTVSILAIGIVLAAASSAAVGQTPASQGSVAGAGVAVIKRQPEFMRMRLELTATGKDLKEALANLKARREAALKVCAAENAVADSIVVGSPRIAPDVHPAGTNDGLLQSDEHSQWQKQETGARSACQRVGVAIRRMAFAGQRRGRIAARQSIAAIEAQSGTGEVGAEDRAIARARRDARRGDAKHGESERLEAGRSGVLLRGEDFQCRLCQSGRQGVCNGQEPRPAAGQRRRRFAR